MPTYTRGTDISIYYEEYGDAAGFPVLLFAPGLMRSSGSRWDNTDLVPRKVLGNAYRVIAMDQRNAGKSVADVKPDHGWHTFAGDHFALMDHLGFGKFHVLGGCIGGSYCFEAIEHDAGRIGAAVLQNPIGLWENRDTWDEAVKGYSATVRGRDPSISEATIQSFGKNMFGNDFVFSVTRDFVKNCGTPLYLQPGTDKPHPAKTSEEIAALAPNIEVQKDWKGPAYLDQSIKRVRVFLERNTPKG